MDTARPVAPPQNRKAKVKVPSPQDVKDLRRKTHDDGAEEILKEVVVLLAKQGPPLFVDVSGKDAKSVEIASMRLQERGWSAKVKERQQVDPVLRVITTLEVLER